MAYQAKVCDFHEDLQILVPPGVTPEQNYSSTISGYELS